MTEYRHRQRTLPFVVTGDPGGPSLRTLIERDGDRLRRLLTAHGAVLFRGFPVAGIDGFQSAVGAFSTELLAYSERSSPRSSIQGNVYTSTDYPPDEEIFLHNENSYQLSWPRLVYFFCARPPETLGATPLADIRQVYDLIDPSVRDEFARRGWMVVRNFRTHFGVGWREVFNTDDRGEVAEYCQDKGIMVEWQDAESLRTKAIRQAVHVHPDTGEPVWFNHITFFHCTTLPDDVREGLIGLFGEEGLPTNTYYGDGGRIPDEVIAHLRACYRAQSRRFDWEQNDVLMVDNMAVAHGREPFTGSRSIAVAMAEPCTSSAPVERV
jgi:alpha-ketoglutarate-dependent taurine dioxygenase